LQLADDSASADEQCHDPEQCPEHSRLWVAGILQQVLNRLRALRTDHPPKGRYDLLLGRLAPEGEPRNGNGAKENKV
jgi:hypothetical protein